MYKGHPFAAVKACEKTLRMLETLFRPGVKLSLIVRDTASPDGDVLITKDDLQELIAVCERSKSREFTTLQNMAE